MNKKTRAEKWAEAYLNSEEGQEAKRRWNREFIDYMILGKPTEELDETFLNDLKNWPNSITITEKLSLEEIIEKYDPSPETIEHIKRIQDGK